MDYRARLQELRCFPSKSRIEIADGDIDTLNDGAILRLIGMWLHVGVLIHPLLGQEAQWRVDNQAQDPRQAAEPFLERHRRLV